MIFEGNVIINIYSILLLIVMYIHVLKDGESQSLQHKLFVMMIRVTFLMLVFDIFGRFDGKSSEIYPVINYWGNFLIYLVNLVLPSLWLLYVGCQVFHDEGRIRRWIRPLLAINAVNAGMLVLSQFFGWLYYIDSDNIYHRGELYWVPVVVTIALILVAGIIVIVNREKIEKEYCFSLLLFGVFPLAGIILNLLYNGTSIMLNSVVLSTFVVYINVQHHSMYTDYLTGISNRKKLETYTKKKIRASTENNTFSAILIDMDDFKSINDTFGHDMGDDALETSVKLIRSCLRPDDFIARFGGDEFYIVLDATKKSDVEEVACRISRCINKFNDSGFKPYKLSCSMGYAVYDYHSHMKVEEFQKQIDSLMYENKRVNKEIYSES